MWTELWYFHCRFFLKKKDLFSHQILKRIQVFVTGGFVTSAISRCKACIYSCRIRGQFYLDVQSGRKSVTLIGQNVWHLYFRCPQKIRNYVCNTAIYYWKSNTKFMICAWSTFWSKPHVIFWRWIRTGQT